MGSYAYITIEQYPLFLSKWFYSEWFFRGRERVVRRVKESQRNQILWPCRNKDRDDERTEFLYVLPGPELRRRLGLAGFGDETLEEDFKDTVGRRIGELSGSLEASLRERAYYPPNRTFPKSVIQTLENSTLDDWLNCFKKVIQLGVSPYGYDEQRKKASSQVEDLYFAGLFRERHMTGFPCKKLENLAVAVLRLFPEAECVLDVTDLWGAGHANNFKDLHSLDRKYARIFAAFNKSLDEAESLMPLAPDSASLIKRLRSQIISALEKYLSENFELQTMNREACQRRFLKTYKAFEEEVALKNIIVEMGSLNNYVLRVLKEISFLDLGQAKELYASVLRLNFDDENATCIMEAVRAVSGAARGGEKPDGAKKIKTDSGGVEALARNARGLAANIDKQVKAGYALSDTAYDDYDRAAAAAAAKRSAMEEAKEEEFLRRDLANRPKGW